MDDRFHFLCNSCHQNQCDCQLTESQPDRKLWAGDTYHFDHLPPNVAYWRAGYGLGRTSSKPPSLPELP